jgi:DNA-binding protein HU-beta
MPDRNLRRIEREELVRLAAQRTDQDLVPVGKVVHAFLDEIYERSSAAIKRGQGVTLKGFGGFFVRPERESWVFKFNPCQKWRALFGWSSTYKGEL